MLAVAMAGHEMELAECLTVRGGPDVSQHVRRCKG